MIRHGRVEAPGTDAAVRDRTPFRGVAEVVVARGDEALLRLVRSALPSHGPARYQVSRLEGERLAASGMPRLFLVHVAADEADPILALRSIHMRFPSCPMLLVADAGGQQLVCRAMRSGVEGFLLREDIPACLADAVGAVLTGGRFVSESLMQWILHGLSDPAAMAQRDPVGQLTDRERMILRFLGRGFESQRIAQELELNVKTVFSHRANIRRKIGLHDNESLARFAAEWLRQLENPPEA